MTSNGTNNGWAFSDRPWATDPAGANTNGGTGGDGGGGGGEGAELPKYNKVGTDVMPIFMVDTSVARLS